MLKRFKRTDKELASATLELEIISLYGHISLPRSGKPYRISPTFPQANPTIQPDIAHHPHSTAKQADPSKPASSQIALKSQQFEPQLLPTPSSSPSFIQNGKDAEAKAVGKISLRNESLKPARETI